MCMISCTNVIRLLTQKQTPSHQHGNVFLRSFGTQKEILTSVRPAKVFHERHL